MSNKNGSRDIRHIISRTHDYSLAFCFKQKNKRNTEPKNIKERNKKKKKNKTQNSKYKSWNSEMFISLMVSELSLYDGLVQYGLYVRGINRSQVFQVICSSP